MGANIRLGPAGSPAASTLDGIAKVKGLGLQAMEVQFSHGIKMGIELAKQVGDERKKYGIELSVHAPYYINLASKETKKIDDSKKRILDSCERMHHMGGGAVVFHPAYFSAKDKESVFQTTKKAILELVETVKKKKWNSLVTIETTGKHSALGSLDESLRMVKETGCFLCIDFAHLYARNYGNINYGNILDKVEPLKLDHLHMHFSNISYTLKGERNHEVLNGHPPFRPLAEELLNRKLNATIICESPVTWKDSLRMKDIFEGLGYSFD